MCDDFVALALVYFVLGKQTILCFFVFFCFFRSSCSPQANQPTTPTSSLLQWWRLVGPRTVELELPAWLAELLVRLGSIAQ